MKKWSKYNADVKDIEIVDVAERGAILTQALANHENLSQQITAIYNESPSDHSIEDIINTIRKKVELKKIIPSKETRGATSKEVITDPILRGVIELQKYFDHTIKNGYEFSSRVDREIISIAEWSKDYTKAFGEEISTSNVNNFWSWVKERAEIANKEKGVDPEPTERILNNRFEIGEDQSLSQFVRVGFERLIDKTGKLTSEEIYLPQGSFLRIRRNEFQIRIGRNLSYTETVILMGGGKLR